MCTRDLPQHLLIAAGAGFVGASLAIAIRTTHQREDVLALDLSALILEQLAQPDDWNGATVNVGGGVERSISPAGAGSSARAGAPRTSPATYWRTRSSGSATTQGAVRAALL